MHHPPGFKSPGVSSKMRFQSTAQMAMHDTGSKYGGLETPAERAAQLKQRKLNNTTTNIAFGSHPIKYETMMKANDDYDRSVVDVAAGSGDGAGMTPYELKQKLATANWDFGDGTSAKVNGYERASTLADPTGPAFLSYKGQLNADVRAAIRTSSLHLGSHDHGGEQYDTTSRRTMALAANDTDYAGDKRRALAMKKALTSSSLNLASDEVRGPEDYVSTGHLSMAYDPVAARTASGQMDPSMQKDLRAQHFVLGYGGHTTETTEKERQRKAAEAVEKRRREIIQSTGNTAMHPDLLMMNEDKARVKDMKKVLLQTSITIGDDPDYL